MVDVNEQKDAIIERDADAGMHARTHARTLARSHACNRIQALIHARTHACTNDLIHARAHLFTHSCALKRARTLARIPSCAQATRTRTLLRAGICKCHTRTHTRSHARTLARSLARNLYRALRKENIPLQLPSCMGINHKGHRLEQRGDCRCDAHVSACAFSCWCARLRMCVWLSSCCA